MLHKSLTGVQVKDAERGLVTAVFATLGVIDRDGDVTVAGAFKNGQNVSISAYGHTSWQGALPVGAGVIREVGNQAILDGRFFLDTTSGKDTFRTVKALGDLTEWSYGYTVLKSSPGTQDGRSIQFLESLDVTEVSPVLAGAGVDTRTLSTKGESRSGTLTPDDLRVAQWRLIRADPAKMREAKARVAVRMAQEQRLAEQRLGRAMLLLARFPQ